MRGDYSADVVIVGGGYTGLWAALRVRELEPASRIILLEADICGGGPSGRNGGFMDPWRVKYFAMKAIMGSEETIRAIRLSVRALDEIIDFCSEHEIDAQITRGGGLWVSSSHATENTWAPTVEALRSVGLGENYRDVSAEEVVELTGSSRYVGGVFDAERGKAQPALLARGLRRVALENGVEIFENSPVTRLERGSTPIVHTEGGRVRSSRVILAAGAWLGQLHELRNAIAVVGSDMIATERMPERLADLGDIDRLVISDSRMMVNYYRTTADGRLAWGFGGGSLDFGARIGENMHSISPRPAAVAASLEYHYPQLGLLKVRLSP
ncbi:FAD-dependent oxidoreductase [Microbacterium sp. Mu-80]|uniref:FAD-dependent oxidoreductase n=1 Tax=Microbacterium bandirmense TaxID=3122050 RepID=A0ABU8LI41_9MICO